MSLKNKKISIGALCVLVCFAGCATVQGPSIDRREINEETKRLELKSLEYTLNQIQKVNAIGYNLITMLEEDEIKIKTRPFIGLFVLPIDRVSNRLFNARPKEGAYIAFVLDETPLKKAGIQAGDVLISLNGEKIKSTKQVVKFMKEVMKKTKVKVGDSLTLKIVRDGVPQEISVEVEEIPINVAFTVIADVMVNAFATHDHVLITKGLLNFVKSDDELAASISHEIAHIARGHYKRKAGGVIFSTVAGLSLGITAEVFIPGTGEIVMNGAQGVGNLISFRFSRDLEREADYFSCRMMYKAGYDLDAVVNFQERFSVEIPISLSSGYLNTHPSSPERKLRLIKIKEELEESGEIKQAK